MKLVKLIANLGYGSRKDVTQLFRSGRITDADGEVLYADDVVAYHGTPEPGTTLIQKPFLPAVLLVKVREVLDAAKQSQPSRTRPVMHRAGANG